MSPLTRVSQVRRHWDRVLFTRRFSTDVQKPTLSLRRILPDRLRQREGLKLRLTLRGEAGMKFPLLVVIKRVSPDTGGVCPGEGVQGRLGAGSRGGKRPGEGARWPEARTLTLKTAAPGPSQTRADA